jgi:NAD(P)-dependent dehydrogenase (short-subunit alcohol dehydrogenase family)
VSFGSSETGSAGHKVVLVTGAGRGIGAAVARRLAADGAALILADRHEPSLADVVGALTAGGTDVLAAAADVSDADAVARLVDTAVDRFGRLDGAVNNAGVTGPRALIADYPL